MEELVTKIKNALADDSPEDWAYAIRSAVINKINTEFIVSRLQKLKSDNTVVMFNTISNMAVTALDLLGIEKYTGDNVTIIEMIETDFYTG